MVDFVPTFSKAFVKFVRDFSLLFEDESRFPPVAPSSGSDSGSIGRIKKFSLVYINSPTGGALYPKLYFV